jgi:hypothetical protein
MRMQESACEQAFEKEPEAGVSPEVTAEMALSSWLFARELELSEDDAARLEAYLTAVDEREAALRAWTE